MQTKQILLVALGVIIAMKVFNAQAAKQKVESANPSMDGTNFISDMWARLHGQDLSVNDDNPVQTNVGGTVVKGSMGWSYGWDGSVVDAHVSL